MDLKLQFTLEVFIFLCDLFHFVWATQILETWLGSARIIKGQQIDMLGDQESIS